MDQRKKLLRCPVSFHLIDFSRHPLHIGRGSRAVGKMMHWKDVVKGIIDPQHQCLTSVRTAVLLCSKFFPKCCPMPIRTKRLTRHLLKIARLAQAIFLIVLERRERFVVTALNTHPGLQPPVACGGRISQVSLGTCRTFRSPLHNGRATRSTETQRPSLCDPNRLCYLALFRARNTESSLRGRGTTSDALLLLYSGLLRQIVQRSPSSTYDFRCHSRKYITPFVGLPVQAF